MLHGVSAGEAGTCKGTVMLVTPVVAGKCNTIGKEKYAKYVTAVVGNKGTSVNLTYWPNVQNGCQGPPNVPLSGIVPLDDCFHDHFYYTYNATSGIVDEIMFGGPHSDKDVTKDSDDYQEIIDKILLDLTPIKFRGVSMLDDVKNSKDFSKDVIRSGGLGVCGDPCLHSTDCALNLFCHEESTVCVDKDTKFMLGEHCNAVSTKSKSSMENDVAFNKCSCNLVHKAECAGAVAGCAIACAGSFGPACVSCIGVIGGCCDCASALFGFDCSHC